MKLSNILLVELSTGGKPRTVIFCGEVLNNMSRSRCGRDVCHSPKATLKGKTTYGWFDIRFQAWEQRYGDMGSSLSVSPSLSVPNLSASSVEHNWNPFLSKPSLTNRLVRKIEHEDYPIKPRCLGLGLCWYWDMLHIRDWKCSRTERNISPRKKKEGKITWTIGQVEKIERFFFHLLCFDYPCSYLSM